MTIHLVIEGKAEIAFVKHLRLFLKSRLTTNLPKLDPVPIHGPIPPKQKLVPLVKNLLSLGKDHQVVILTDVKTPVHKFEDANHARLVIADWLGDLTDRVDIHAAQHEIEAWLIPFWPAITKLARSTKPKPSRPPEQINHLNPPSALLSETWRTGSGKNRKYNKVLHLDKILEEQDLSKAAQECPTLKDFLNCLLRLSGAQPL